MTRRLLKVPDAEELQIGSQIGNHFMEINSEDGTRNLAMVRTHEATCEKPRDLRDFAPVDAGMRYLRLFSIAPQLLRFAWRVLAVESQIGPGDMVKGPHTELMDEARELIQFVEGKAVGK